jgi:hypothetical protein
MYAGYAEAYPVKILAYPGFPEYLTLFFFIGLRRNAVPCLNEKPSVT